MINLENAHTHEVLWYGPKGKGITIFLPEEY